MNTPRPPLVPYIELRPRYGEMRSRNAIREAIRKGEYPAPKKASPGRIGWESAALDNFYDALPTVNYSRSPEAA